MVAVRNVMAAYCLLLLGMGCLAQTARAAAGCLTNPPSGTVCICSDPKLATSASCVSQADVAQYRFYESNEAAGVICRMFNILSGNVARALAGFVIVITGLGAYQGRLEVKTIMYIVIAVAIIFSAPAMLSLVAPTSDVGSGCQCKTVAYLPTSTPGSKLKIDLGLNSDCSEKVALDTTSTG
jgi:type IV secretory pathway VirB2 component (pilin)